MPRPIRARIDLGALRHNHALARRHVGEGHLWCVIKADAYGHGVLDAALALRDHADGFALVEFEAAALLREQGVRNPILMLEGIYQADDLAACAALDLTPALHAPWQVEALAEAALPRRVPVYLKLDTGMHRLGLDAAQLRDALARLAAADCASSITLMTHFADADEDRGIEAQMARLREMTAGMRLPRSLANSAALLRFPETTATQDHWARPGIMLYGSSPFPARESASALGLRPVMTLESEVISIRDLAPGDRVGYGGTFVADAPMRVGVVACGYGDGYPRHAPTGTPVLVAGQRTRTLGRVSMDKLCVDLTHVAKVSLGGTALLWGENGSGRLDADEVAMAAGTIAYELFCALAARVPIEYVG